jgi:predicted GNAT superfamily acetyltransferase
MIEFTSSNTEKDLKGILELQRANLADALTPGEIQREGFVTVVHSFDVLKKLNGIEKHIIAKEHDKVIAYLLAMTQQSKHDIPILIPMFKIFEETMYEDKPVSSYNYLVVGQVCVAKEYRGRGVLDKCYDAYKNYFSNKYDFAITEIDYRNLRSINAHKRIGFKEIYRYVSGKTEWSIVVWDWQGL